jgi:hypothetical protein
MGDEEEEQFKKKLVRTLNLNLKLLIKVLFLSFPRFHS